MKDKHDINPLALFPWITAYTPVIPKLYWDVYSAEERMKALCMEWDRIFHYLLDICNQININTDDITELKQQFEDFKAHGFDDYYRQQIADWINEHGYFCAYVPKEWAKHIQFTTGANYGGADYGCLILQY